MVWRGYGANEVHSPVILSASEESRNPTPEFFARAQNDNNGRTK